MMRSEINLARKPQSPKFVRRSMSPIDYINTEQYKQKIKKNEIKIDFTFLSDKKFEKLNIKKRGSRVPLDSKEKLQIQTSDKLQNFYREQTASTKFNESQYQTQEKIMDELNIQTNFIKNLDEEGEGHKNQYNILRQFQHSRNRILQLQQQLESKNKKIQQQQKSLQKKNEQYLQCLNRQKNCQNQCERLRIKMVMQQRKNQQYQNCIKKLKAANRKYKQSENIPPRQHKLTQIKPKARQMDFFQLSPQKFDRSNILY